MSIISVPSQGNTTGRLLSQSIAPGILIALACFQLPPSDTQFQVFVDIGLMADTQDVSGRRLQLASGYLRQQSGITWTGAMIIHPGDRIYMIIRGISTSPVELIERRLTPEAQIIPGVTLRNLLEGVVKGGI